MNLGIMSNHRPPISLNEQMNSNTPTGGYPQWNTMSYLGGAGTGAAISPADGNIPAFDSGVPACGPQYALNQAPRMLFPPPQPPSVMLQGQSLDPVAKRRRTLRRLSQSFDCSEEDLEKALDMFLRQSFTGAEDVDPEKALGELRASLSSGSFVLPDSDTSGRNSIGSQSRPSFSKRTSWDQTRMFLSQSDPTLAADLNELFNEAKRDVFSRTFENENIQMNGADRDVGTSAAQATASYDSIYAASTTSLYQDQDKVKSGSNNVGGQGSSQVQAAVSAGTFICSQKKCNKAFITKNALQRHMSSHTKRPFVCTYPACGKSFTERARLNRHQIIHRAEKPFTCTYKGCNKKFSYKQNMETHLRTHTGSKPYACNFPGCKQRFSQSSNRNTHERRHQLAEQKKRKP